LGRLNILTILFAMGVSGAATEGALAQDPAPQASRKNPPAPPSEYVKAGVQLYQKNDYGRAAEYFKAASDYRDMLSVEDQVTLEKYRGLMDQVRSPVDSATVPAATTAPSSYSAAPTTPTPSASGAIPPGFDPSQVEPATRGGTSNPKWRARWLLQEARRQIQLGQFDTAAAKIAEARAFHIKWGLFDDTPDKVEESLRKVRAAAPPAVAANAAPGIKGDKREAQTRLKQARKMIAAGQCEQAESIAGEVASWGHRYTRWEDTPNKVAVAARAVRSRDQLRKLPPRAQPSPDIYDIHVKQARELMAQGQLDAAEAKARFAQQMNVVPTVNADRAEDVMHEIAMARSKVGVDSSVTMASAAQQPGMPPAAISAPAPELAAVNPATDPTGLPNPTAQPAPADGIPAAPMTGQQYLDSAKAFMIAGNFAAAKEAARQAKAAGSLDAPSDEILAQIGLTEQTSTLHVYDAALDAWRKADYARARALLQELTREDLDEGTRQKVEDLIARLPQDNAGKASVGPVGDAANLNAQRLKVEVGTKLGEARRLMETDPDKAIDLLNKTLDSIKASGVSESLSRGDTRRVEVALELAKKDKVAFDAKMKDKEQRVEIERKRLRILEADKAKKDQIAQIMAKANEAAANGKFEEAEALAKRGSEIDPNDPSMVAMAHVMRLKRRFERDNTIRSEKEDNTVLAFQGVDASSYAPRGVLDRDIDPGKGFSELTRRRVTYDPSVERRKSAKELAVEAKLNELVSVNFDKRPLAECVNFLATYTGLNIVLDPGALAEAPATEQTPVTLSLKDAKLKQVLKIILKSTGLTYSIDEGVLLLTSPQIRRTDLIVRYYYVGDLVMATRQTTNAGQMTGSPAPAPTGLSANGTPLGPTFPAPGDPNVAAAAAFGMNGQVSTADRPTVDFGPVIHLIKSTVAPGSWLNQEGAGEPAAAYGMGANYAGGAGDAPDVAQIGTITPFFLNISLIIRHTAEVHDEIVDLLRQLRRLQDLQVSIEVRFITVSDNFFEQIGVDFDFAIASDAVGRKSSFAANAPGAGNLFNGGAQQQVGQNGTVVPAYVINPQYSNSTGPKGITAGLGSSGDPNYFARQSSLGQLSIPFSQDSFSQIAPFNAVPGSGANFGIAFLSDLEVYLFMTALQGDTRSNLVQAPKVTTFNGANATINSANIINYVSQLIPIVGAGAVAFQPIPSQILDGVNLNVTPVVSADRRYVRMTLAPFFNTFSGFDTISVPAAVGGGGLGGQATSVNGTIQLPRTTVNNVNTTVTVPDGGTVLLGGVKRLREERKEAGTPILSKTPLINRLFRNIGIGRETDSLMLMVTPRIIILEEEEERLGIPAVNNPAATP
jgi:general secretion pathway protein D